MSTKATYVVINVSGGTSKDLVWASVEVCNPYCRPTGREENVSNGSPVVQLKLIDRNTGKPNVKLAKQINDAMSRIFLQPIEFEGVHEIVKKGGVEQMTFTVFDAFIPELKQQPKSA